MSDNVLLVGPAGSGKTMLAQNLSGILPPLGFELFWDEFTEFRRNVIDLLRQPLEEGQVTVESATVTLSYPASRV
jgi:predicted ATPase with chaperone activity